MYEITLSYPSLKDARAIDERSKSSIVAVKGSEILIQHDENYRTRFVDIATEREDGLVNVTMTPSKGYPAVKIESIKMMMDAGFKVYEIFDVKDALHFMRNLGAYNLG